MSVAEYKLWEYWLPHYLPGYLLIYKMGTVFYGAIDWPSRCEWLVLGDT